MGAKRKAGIDAKTVGWSSRTGGFVSVRETLSALAKLARFVKTGKPIFHPATARHTFLPDNYIQRCKNRRKMQQDTKNIIFFVRPKLAECFLQDSLRFAGTLFLLANMSVYADESCLASKSKALFADPEK